MSSDDEDLDSVSEEEEAPQKARKQRKKKAKKDPNKPKRNMSAFFLYSNSNRDRVKEENPDAKFGDIVSLGVGVLCAVFLFPAPSLCMLHLTFLGGFRHWPLDACPRRASRPRGRWLRWRARHHTVEAEVEWCPQGYKARLKCERAAHPTPNLSAYCHEI